MPFCGKMVLSTQEVLLIISPGRLDGAPVSVPGHVPVVCRRVPPLPRARVSLGGSSRLQSPLLFETHLDLPGFNNYSHICLVQVS